MKLSIVIPCYNAEKDIGNLIEKIGNQLNSNVELILVNDGSSDSTKSIIQKIISKKTLYSKQCRLINIDNSGAAKARTIGLESALGEFVFFCDADDNISPKFIDRIMSIISNNDNIDMIYYTSVIIKENGSEINKVLIKEDGLSDDNSKVLDYLLQDGGYTSAVWSYVFRRELAIRHGAYFTDRVAHEDHMFTLTILANAKNIYLISDAMYFQVHELGSLTRSKKNFSYIKERYWAFLETKELIQDSFGKDIFKKYDVWTIKSILVLISQNKHLLSSPQNLIYSLYILSTRARALFSLFMHKII